MKTPLPVTPRPKIARRYKPVDRSQQGAAQSGAPNLPTPNLPTPNLPTPNLPIVEKVVDKRPAPGLQLPSPSEYMAPALSRGPSRMIITLTYKSSGKYNAVFISGNRRVTLSKSMFAGDPPETFDIDGPFTAPAATQATKKSESAAAKLARATERFEIKRKKLEAKLAELNKTAPPIELDPTEL